MLMNRDELSLKKSTQLLEMSVGEKLRKNRVCKYSGGGEAA